MGGCSELVRWQTSIPEAFPDEDRSDESVMTPRGNFWQRLNNSVSRCWINWTPSIRILAAVFKAKPGRVQRDWRCSDLLRFILQMCRCLGRVAKPKKKLEGSCRVLVRARAVLKKILMNNRAVIQANAWCVCVCVWGLLQSFLTGCTKIDSSLQWRWWKKQSCL